MSNQGEVPEEDVSSSAVSGHQTLIDLAEWWIRVLLHSADLERFQELETILPALSAMPSKSALASQFRVLSLWQEVLANAHLKGDFSLLQDKLLLLSTLFEKSPLYDDCMQLLKVHGQLASLHATFASNAKVEEIKTAMQGCKEALEAIFLGNRVPTELLDLCDEKQQIVTLRSQLENMLVQKPAESVFGYQNLEQQMQRILLQWIENEYETPLLIQLGYRLPEGMSEAGALDAAQGSVHSGQRTPVSKGKRKSSRAILSAPPKYRTHPTAVSRRAGLSKEDSDATLDMTIAEANETPEASKRKPAAASTPRRRKKTPEKRKAGELDTQGEQARAQTVPRRRSKRSRIPRVPAAEEAEGEPQEKVAAPPTAAPADPVATEEGENKENSPTKKAIKDEDELSKWFDMSDEEESSSPLKHRRRSRSRPRSQSSSPQKSRLSSESSPQSGVSGPNHPAPTLVKSPARLVSRKRRRFTKEENKAIQDGVKLYGDHWVKIREHFTILGVRSTMQLKDQARTLVKNGKLDMSLLQKANPVLPTD